MRENIRQARVIVNYKLNELVRAKTTQVTLSIFVSRDSTIFLSG